MTPPAQARATAFLRWAYPPLLATAFAMLSGLLVLGVAHDGLQGGDLFIYRQGTVAWLAGLDPWSAGNPLAHYAGAPTTLLLAIPLTWVPAAVFAPLAILAAACTAAWIIRRLDLPMWWVLFPPLVHAVAVANPGVFVLALLLVRSAWGGGFATLVKATAILPVIGERRWSAIVVTVAVLAVSIGLAPALWIEYVQRFGAIGSRLVAEVHGPPPLFLSVIGAVSLALVATRDVRAAGWLAVAAIWPAWEFHYAVFALPVSLLPATLIALSLPPQLAVAAYAAWLWLRPRRATLGMWGWLRGPLRVPVPAPARL